MRDLYGVTIPQGIQFVFVEARDKKYGYGGARMEAVLPGR